MTGPASVTTINPASGTELAIYAESSDAQLDAALDAAAGAQQGWAQTSFGERRERMHAAAAVLRRRRDEWAALITAEMGKPLAEAEAELDKCAWNCEFYAEEAQRFLADEPVPSGAARSFIGYAPLGVVLAIMPWNFPFWQAVRFAAPALMAGNGAVLKHSPNVTGCGLAVEQLFAEAGFPRGLFGAVVVGPERVDEVTRGLIADPRIAAVTLTGSERAGRAVGAAAGAALKKAVLELGGSDPFVVLADADLEAVAAQAARSRFLNAGQSCIAAKRFIVEAGDPAVAEEFETHLVKAVSALPVGDPTDRSTQVGPLARSDLVDGLERQVDESVRQGARVLLGGSRLERPGCYYAPTVLADVTPQLPAFREETFGPVAAVVRAADEEHLVALANDTVYGLGASIWTRDPERGLRLGRRIASGALFVNGIVASDPRLPFGGIKASGYGRELGAVGIREFTNIRTFWVGEGSGTLASGPAAE